MKVILFVMTMVACGGEYSPPVGDDAGDEASLAGDASTDVCYPAKEKCE